jgi:broad specificity phosphatase PhoE
LQPIKGAIKHIVSGPLQRTRDHADIAAQALGFAQPIEIDARLREIDYGLWEARSTDEIHALGGADELKAWDKSGAWPISPGWSPPQETIAANVAQLAQSLATSLDGNDAALLITSNGILKFFPKLVPGAFEDMAAKGLLKVATGNCCALTREAGAWRVRFWNMQPTSLSFA